MANSWMKAQLEMGLETITPMCKELEPSTLTTEVNQSIYGRAFFQTQIFRSHDGIFNVLSAQTVDPKTKHQELWWAPGLNILVYSIYAMYHVYVAYPWGTAALEDARSGRQSTTWLHRFQKPVEQKKCFVHSGHLVSF